MNSTPTPALDLEAIRARLNEVGLVARAHLDRGRSSMPITIEDATLLPILLAEVDRLREELAERGTREERMMDITAELEAIGWRTAVLRSCGMALSRTNPLTTE